LSVDRHGSSGRKTGLNFRLIVFTGQFSTRRTKSSIGSGVEIGSIAVGYIGLYDPYYHNVY